MKQSGPQPELMQIPGDKYICVYIYPSGYIYCRGVETGRTEQAAARDSTQPEVLRFTDVLRFTYINSAETNVSTSEHIRLATYAAGGWKRVEPNRPQPEVLQNGFEGYN